MMALLQISSTTPVITGYSVDTRIESHPSLPMIKGSLNGNDAVVQPCW